jgi:hypothetical protein
MELAPVETGEEVAEGESAALFEAAVAELADPVVEEEKLVCVAWIGRWSIAV